MATFRVNESMVVTCFTRGGSAEPLFVVREFDTKVIRVKKANKKGLSEQAIRASVRQAILNLDLELLPATKEEINFLKSVGILGKRAPSASLLTGNDMARLLEQFGRYQMAAQLRASLKTVSPMPIVDFNSARELIAANQAIALANVGSPSSSNSKSKKKKKKEKKENENANVANKRKATQAFNEDNAKKDGTVTSNENDEMEDEQKVKEQVENASSIVHNNWSEVKIGRRTAMVDEDGDDDAGSVQADDQDDDDNAHDSSDDDEYSHGGSSVKRRRTSSMPDIHSFAVPSTTVSSSSSMLSSSASPLLITAAGAANGSGHSDSAMQGMHALLSAAASRMPSDSSFASTSALTVLPSSRDDSITSAASLLPRISSLGSTTSSSLISTRSLSTHRSSVVAPALQSLRLARTFSGTTFGAIKSPTQSSFPPALSPTAIPSSSTCAAASSLSSSGSSATFMQNISPILNSRIPLAMTLPTMQRTNSPNLYPNSSLSSPHARTALPAVFNRLQSSATPIHVRAAVTSPIAQPTNGIVALNVANFNAVNPSSSSYSLSNVTQLDFPPRLNNSSYANANSAINNTNGAPPVLSTTMHNSNNTASLPVVSPSNAFPSATVPNSSLCTAAGPFPTVLTSAAAMGSGSVSAPGLSPLSSDTELDSFTSTPLTSRTPSPPPASSVSSAPPTHDGAPVSSTILLTHILPTSRMPVEKIGCAQIGDEFESTSITAS